MSHSGIRPLYSLRQITKALRMDRRTVRKLLAQHDVEIVRVGPRIYVPLTEIVSKLEIVWNSLKTAEHVTRKRVLGRYTMG